MPSTYLDPSEYSAYDLPDTVTPGLVNSASALIDAYCKRKEGLIWTPDFAGNPAYMAAATPLLTITGQGSIASGSNVVVPYTGAVLDNNAVGEVVILDRAQSTKIEACVIQAVAPPPSQSVTLKTVQTPHADACTIEFGLTVMEEKELPNDRSIARVSKFPVMKLQSGAGRYGYGRRSSQSAGNFQEFNLLAIVSSFGGPPLWIPWEVTNASTNFRTGEIWVPAGVLLAYYTEVRVWYVPGFSKANLHPDIKQACANIVRNLKETGLGANIRSRSVRGDMVVSKFENNMIDKNTRDLIEPFRARVYV